MRTRTWLTALGLASPWVGAALSACDGDRNGAERPLCPEGQVPYTIAESGGGAGATSSGLAGAAGSRAEGGFGGSAAQGGSSPKMGCRPKMPLVAPSPTDLCPELTHLYVGPRDGAVDELIYVEALVVDQGSDDIWYRWSAPSGDFAEPNQPKTVYSCTTLGNVVLRLNYGDERGCKDHTDVSVRCIGASD
jgi:hypothetical protein